MIIKYKFLSKLTDKASEVEVSEELGRAIEQMDTDDFNLNRLETRRHRYMSQLEESGHYIAADSDPLYDVLKNERHDELMAAIEKLKPQQKELLRRIYKNGETQEEISEYEEEMLARNKTELKKSTPSLKHSGMSLQTRKCRR